MARRALFFLLVLFLAGWTSPASAQAAPEPPPGDTLWLATDENQRPDNFTGFPPTETEPTVIELTLRNLTSTVAQWRSAVPGHWNVTTAEGLSSDLWLVGLDRVTPVADPKTHPEAIGKVMVLVELYRGDETTPFAEGATEVDVDHLAPREEARQVHVDLDVSRETAFVPGGAGLLFRLYIPGYVRPEDTLRLHVGATDTPSSVTLPGYPTDGFRMWEEAERAERACNEAILQKRPCVEPAEQAEPEQRGAPAPAAFVALLVVLPFAVRRLNRIRCR